jgi:hypothetical protein
MGVEHVDIARCSLCEDQAVEALLLAQSVHNQR